MLGCFAKSIWMLGRRGTPFFLPWVKPWFFSCLACSVVTYTNCDIPYNISSPGLHNFRGAVPSPCYLVCEDVEEYGLLWPQTADKVKDKIIQGNITHCMKCMTELTVVIYCISSVKMNNLSICSNFLWFQNSGPLWVVTYNFFPLVIVVSTGSCVWACLL
jgi:hypothetical protein